MNLATVFVRPGARRALAAAALALTLTATPFAAAGTALAAPTGPASADSQVLIQAAHWCECVEYIRNRYGLSRGADAKDMGPVLRSAGFRQVSAPQPGAVVIFQPSFGPGINQDHGHIGVVTSVASADAGRNWRISVRGANQGGSSTENNCTDVGTTPYKAYPKNSNAIAYFVR